MSKNIYRGTVISSRSWDEISVLEKGYIAVEDGIITGVYASLPEEYADCPVTDYGDRMIIPAFSDMHMHASQYTERGVGMDCLLFDWLNNYTFPQESGFADREYARVIYPQVIREFLRHGSFQVSLFTTIHYEACDMLYRMLIDSGLYAYTGKINMDMNSPEFYVEDTDESIRETERFIEEHIDLSDKVRMILIPRFAPTCSEKLLKGLGELSRKYDLGVHTHVVESKAEAAWAKELYPQCSSDSEIYEMTGLLQGKGPKIFAHVIFPTETEDRIISQYGALSVHCPDSTTNVTAGIMPVSTLHEKGYEIALGSDIGGGHFAGIYRQVSRAVQLSKMKEFYEEGYRRIVFANAFYMATVSGGKAFGNIGKLEKGYKFNALVIDDMQDEGFRITPLEALERFCYSGDDRNIHARFIDGNTVDPDEVYEMLIKKY